MAINAFLASRVAALEKIALKLLGDAYAEQGYPVPEAELKAAIELMISEEQQQQLGETS